MLVKTVVAKGRRRGGSGRGRMGRSWRSGRMIMNRGKRASSSTSRGRLAGDWQEQIGRGLAPFPDSHIPCPTVRDEVTGEGRC